MRIDRQVSLVLKAAIPGRRGPTAGRLPVLMYHGICGEVERDRHPYFAVTTTPAVFETHLQLLQQHRYKVVSLDQGLQLVHAGVKGRFVAITFDDGYEDFLHNAFPLLRKYGVSATVFVPTAFVGSRGGLVGSRSHLDWKQIVELSGQGVDFGSHSHTHREMDRLTEAQIREELVTSRAMLEEHLGQPVRRFCCPFAFPDHDRRKVGILRKLLAQTGYTIGVTTRIGLCGNRSDPLVLPRVPVNEFDDPSLFCAKLAGAYDWLHQVQLLYKKTFKALRRNRNDKD